MTRKHITFHGSVQGVGFRWRARNAANLYGCTGWVRNEWEGTVTMEIQGTEEQIGMVLQAIKAGRFIEIDSMDVKTIPVDPEERGFRTE
ncbi:MAG: acylphosphatase [Clostridia bacterium]|nr:acylphosphatase [Clostridia bacterium]